MKKIAMFAVTTALVLAGCAAPANNANLNATPAEANLNFNVNAVSPTSSGTTVVPNRMADPMIRVASPMPDSTVPKELDVTGQAAGWYFEASFSLKVVDDKGKVLFEGPLTAQSDWMTTSYVPFQGKVTLEQPSAPTGKFIFQKANPSDLPENDRSFEVPVRFGF